LEEAAPADTGKNLTRRKMAQFWRKPLIKPADVLTREELAGIKKAVAYAELLTSGEIAVAILGDCRRGLSTKEQALAEFHHLGLDKTRDKTGVLVLIILQQKAVEILADKGINDKVPAECWNDVVNIIVDGFKAGKPYSSICRAAGIIGERLGESFPRKPDDTNEIPNDVALGE
jgi:uncharacterized membrane protein